MSGGILFDVENHFACVTLDRPKALNSIDPEMDAALFEAWSEINSNPDIWVAVVGATGEKAFCAGANVSGGTEGDGRRMALGGGLTGVGGPLLTLRKPLIAAVQGYSIGGAFELAMCADIIVASDIAPFGIPETTVGIIGEAGIMHRAIRQLAHHIVMAMILTGERIDAQQAERYGLVNEVVPFEKLAETAASWADRIASGSPLAVHAAKDAVLSRAGRPLEVALATREAPIEAYANSVDRLESPEAFAEKRAAQWTGR
ncbi:enoyl-CoA hydratase/isomerase family protein [Rhodococcus sp. USK10]|uniref:enoyl-CoA hydratase-related protein n=1 Tax=Rhodococcus sp. USK10 TaxID=2789739 RepID=UPI001C5F1793|nr:enoyl-CoA hydratase-related protein [Rhodococcus sp. USK10]QYB02145.1 enoyl-CoA hydratase/isomerase family protein [Rhodococcus sp. USK10]